VLARLGVDLAAARRQVTGLLHGQAGSVPLSQRPRRGRRERDQLFDVALARIDALDRQLATIERWVGMRPDLDDIDQQIVRVRRDKEAAIDSQHFETAATLRDQEKELLEARARREKEWTADTAAHLSVAAEFSRVHAELERLRAVLREQGIEPGDGPAQGPAA
jgi:hypothetical protein